MSETESKEQALDAKMHEAAALVRLANHQTARAEHFLKIMRESALWISACLFLAGVNVGMIIAIRLWNSAP